MRNGTSLKNDRVTKAVNLAILGQTDVVVDFPGGGGKQATITTPVKLPLGTVVLPNPMRIGSRADRAAAKAERAAAMEYADADAKPGDTLLNNLTAREYNTRPHAHA